MTKITQLRNPILASGDENGDFVLSSDGKQLAVEREETVEVWDVESDSLLLKGGALFGQGDGYPVGYSDRSSLLTECFDAKWQRVVLKDGPDTVRIWDIETKKPSEPISLPGEPTSISYLSNGDVLLAVPSEGLFVVDGKTNQLKRSIQVPYKNVFHLNTGLCVTISAPEQASGDNDYLQVWDIHTGECLLNYIFSNVYEPVFSEDGQMMCCFDDRSVRVWDLNPVRLRGVVSSQYLSGRILDAVISPDKSILSVVHGQEISTWNLQDFSFLAKFRVGIYEPEHPYWPETKFQRFSRDGTAILADGQAWDARSGHEWGRITDRDILAVQPQGLLVEDGEEGEDPALIRCVPKASNEGSTDGITSVAFSDAERVFASDDAGRIHVIDAESGQQVATFRAHDEAVRDIAVSPDSKLLVTIGDDLTARLWETGSYQPLHKFELPNLPASVCFSRDSKIIGTTEYSKARLFSVESREQLSELDLQGMGYDIGFPGKWRDAAVTCMDPDIVFFPDGGTHPILHDGGVLAIDYFNDGVSYATAGTDGEICVNLRRHEGLRYLSDGHVDWVRDVAISPSEDYLVSCGEDGRIVFWDIETGEKKKTIEAHEGTVWHLSMSDDGKRVASCGRDGMVRIWDTTTYGLVSECRPTSVDALPANEESELDLEIESRAIQLVSRLLATKTHTDAIATINSDTGLDEGLRSRCLVLVKQMSEERTVSVSPRSSDFAASMSSIIRDNVYERGGSIGVGQLALMRTICLTQSNGEFWNILGVAEYRSGNYRAAIKAAEQSVKLLPEQMGLDTIFPVDVAILSLSHSELGAADLATKFQQQFWDLMNHEDWKSNDYCLGLAQEMRDASLGPREP